MESLLPTSFQTDANGNVTITMPQAQFFIMSEIIKEKEKTMLEKEMADKVELKEVFAKFIRNYEVLSENSKRNYGQKYKNFLNWCHSEGRDLNFVGEITKEVAEQYIRHSYATKKSAKFEIRTYKRLWNEVLPESYANPWVHKLHLNTFVPKKNMSHRPFKRKEIRQMLTYLDTLAEFKRRDENAKECAERQEVNHTEIGTKVKMRRKSLTFYSAYSEDFVQDLRDAVVFSVTYGMRMGSVAALRWSDFKQFSRKAFFLHLPPKTARAKPTPLELPYATQIMEILERRRPENINAAYRMEEPLFKEFSAVYEKGSQIMSGIFGRLIDKLRIKDTDIGVAAFHSFRTTFVSFMDEANAPKMITDSITGHSSNEMHSLYSKPSPTVKRRWIQRAYANIDFSKRVDEELLAKMEKESWTKVRRGKVK